MSDSLYAHAADTIRVGSRSFAAAARLFDPDTRRSALMLYAWCRHCDDVIDGQTLGHGKADGDRNDAAARLAVLEDLTRQVYAGAAVPHPAFAALTEVVREHAIPEHLPLRHLAGFRMDVAGRRYATFEETLDYCFHVAGVVGIMMARVMGVREPAVLERAADLGIAFQLTNIARDIVEDAEIGRVYLPEDWLAAAGVPASRVGDPQHRGDLPLLAARLLASADCYYSSAESGLPDLPLRSAWAVATALGVYRQIGRKVLAQGEKAWDERTRTSRRDKLRRVAGGGLQAVQSRWLQPIPRRPDLWQAPR